MFYLMCVLPYTHFIICVFSHIHKGHSECAAGDGGCPCEPGRHECRWEQADTSLRGTKEMKAPNKHSQMLAGRDSAHHGRVFFKQMKVKKKCQNHMHSPEPQRQTLVSSYSLPMVCKKPSLKTQEQHQREKYSKRKKVRQQTNTTIQLGTTT